MSTTIGNSAAASNVAQSQALIQSGTLRVAVAGTCNDTSYSLQQLAGQSLDDEPYFADHVDYLHDRRSMPAFSARFRSYHAQPSHQRPLLPLSLAAQAEIRGALWSTMNALVSNSAAVGDLPKITFDTDTLGHILTVTFPSLTGFQPFVATTKRIQLEGDVSYARTYVQEAVTNTLSGNVFILECLGPPLDGIDTSVLYASLKSMVSPLGILEGLAKVVGTSQRWETIEPGILRLYVQLHRSKLAVPYREVVESLPSRFKWHGIAYTLKYPGWHLRSNVVHSADYPESSPAAAPAPGADASSGAVKRPRSSESEGCPHT